VRGQALIAAFALLLSTGVFSLASCRGAEKNGKGPVMTSSQGKTIEDVLQRHTDNLMRIPGVVATALGICDDQPCIKVYVVEMTPALKAAVPASLEGYPVSLEPAGEIRALPDEDAAGP
jgi:hypothetical protein